MARHFFLFCVVLILLFLFPAHRPQYPFAKMKDAEEQAPENTMGGGTAPTAYRRPNSDNLRTAGDPLTLPPNTSFQKFKEYN